MNLKDNAGAVLAIMLVGGMIGAISFVFLKPVPDGINAQILLFLLGQLCGSATTGVSFYLGSSAGSQAKDVTIAGQLPATPEAKK